MERHKAYSNEHCDMTSDGREDKLQCEMGGGGGGGWGLEKLESDL